MLVGLIVALQLANPAFNLGLPWTRFGRLRPLHTNAVIFAFAGNAIFAGIYYSTQRLLKARMFSDILSRLHFWGWQLIIVSAAITLPLGFTTSKEYAELEWPIDIAIALVWVLFAVNFFGTIARRRERHLYVAIWFYIATLVTIAMLHIFNSLRSSPGRQELLDLRGRAGRVHAVVVRAQRGGLLPDDAVSRPDVLLPAEGGGAAGLLVPAVDPPLLDAGLHLHLGGAAPPALHGAPGVGVTLGMLFSVMLWMPSWGGMINGLLTLRGAWNKVAETPSSSSSSWPSRSTACRRSRVR